MRKSLIVSTMTLGICSLLSAQVGINTGENVTPKVTLQIDGKPDITTVQDGILIPRLTRDQLRQKDAIYLADQNGTLVFITDVIGTTSPKTVDITDKGFYYYDNSSAKWAPVSPPASESKDYGKGNFTPNAVSINVSQSIAWSNYSSYNYIEITNPPGVENSTINFPNPSDFNGTVYLFNNSGTLLSFLFADGSEIGPRFLVNAAALHIYSDGTKWYLMAGRQ